MQDAGNESRASFHKGIVLSRKNLGHRAIAFSDILWCILFNSALQFVFCCVWRGGDKNRYMCLFMLKVSRFTRVYAPHPHPKSDAWCKPLSEVVVFFASEGMDTDGYKSRVCGLKAFVCNLFRGSWRVSRIIFNVPDAPWKKLIYLFIGAYLSGHSGVQHWLIKWLFSRLELMLMCWMWWSWRKNIFRLSWNNIDSRDGSSAESF